MTPLQQGAARPLEGYSSGDTPSRKPGVGECNARKRPWQVMRVGESRTRSRLGPNTSTRGGTLPAELVVDGLPYVRALAVTPETRGRCTPEWSVSGVICRGRVCACAPGTVPQSGPQGRAGMRRAALNSEKGRARQCTEEVRCGIDGEYRGWIMCEQDTTRRPAAESAAISQAVLAYALRLANNEGQVISTAVPSMS